MTDDKISVPPTQLGLLCMMMAVSCFVFSFFQSKSQLVADKSELQAVQATFLGAHQSAAIPAGGCGRYGCARSGLPARFHVLVDVDGKDFDYGQQSGIPEAPRIMEIAQGTAVTLLVQPTPESKLDDGLDGNLYELRIGDDTILGYDDTRRYIGGSFWNTRFLFRLAALLLLAVGVAVFVMSPVQNLDDIDE